MHLKMSSVKRWPFCLGPNLLKQCRLRYSGSFPGLRVLMLHNISTSTNRKANLNICIPHQAVFQFWLPHYNFGFHLYCASYPKYSPGGSTYTWHLVASRCQLPIPDVFRLSHGLRPSEHNPNGRHFSGPRKTGEILTNESDTSPCIASYP